MKKVLLIIVFILTMAGLFGSDWGQLNVDPVRYKLHSKIPGNTFNVIFEACLYTPIPSSDGIIYYYYVSENSEGFKCLSGLLMLKYAQKESLIIGWGGSTVTANGKIFRKIILIF